MSGVIQARAYSDTIINRIARVAFDSERIKSDLPPMWDQVSDDVKSKIIESVRAELYTGKSDATKFFSSVVQAMKREFDGQ